MAVRASSASSISQFKTGKHRTGSYPAGFPSSSPRKPAITRLQNMETELAQQPHQQDSSTPKSHIVVAIIENRAKEVGLAAFDIRSAALHLSQFIETSRSYANTTTLLHFFDPIEIIVTPSSTNPQGLAGALGPFRQLQAKKIVLARGCFDDTKGAIMVKNLAVKEPPSFSLDGYFKQYYLCLGAAAAVLKWVENEKGFIIIHHSLQVTVNGSADHMGIDSISVQNLEVIEPLVPTPGLLNKKYSSLFRTLNTTKTTGGYHDPYFVNFLWLDCTVQANCCLDSVFNLCFGGLKASACL